MNASAIERDFQKKVCAQVRLEKEGVGRFRVFTPFLFEDGDHLAIVIKRVGSGWTLSDEGHTFMHLSYDIDERDLQRGTRQKIINNTLSVFSVEDRSGELVLPVPEERYGDALYSFIQALVKISDLSYLSRERVSSTFIDDFRMLLEEAVPQSRRAFDWYDRQHDPHRMYPVDCRINGMARPLFIFAVPNDDRARDATISMLQYEKWSITYRSLGIFEDQESVNRKVLARFSDVCEKQFSSIDANRDRITRYLGELLR